MKYDPLGDLEPRLGTMLTLIVIAIIAGLIGIAVILK